MLIDIVSAPDGTDPPACGAPEAWLPPANRGMADDGNDDPEESVAYPSVVGRSTGTPPGVKKLVPPAVVAWTVPVPVAEVTEIGGAWGESNQNSL